MNTTFGSALVAAALRKNLVKPTDLVKPGMYDPALDWQGQNENQGFLQTTQDATLGGSRLHEQLFGGQGFYADPVTGQRTDYNNPGALADALRVRDTTLGRGQEDFNTATNDLQRSYQRLGASQGGAARQAGVAHGGALQAALKARQGNQSHDQSALDTSWRRLADDTNQNYNTQRGNLLSQAAQGQQDIDTGLSRAGAANTLFNQQLGEAKVGSAQQMGTLPDLPTPNMKTGRASQVPEFVRMGIPGTTPVHVGKEGMFFTQPAVGGGMWHIYANGRRVRVPT